MKKKLAIALTILLLPTLFMILFVLLGGDKPKQDPVWISGFMRTDDGRTYNFSSGSSENKLLYNMIFSLEESSQETEAPQDGLEERISFYIELSENGHTKKITLFPSLDSNCLWTSEDGKVYSLSEHWSDQFINSQYASSVYPNFRAPSLITSAFDTVSPKTASWSYALKNGKFEAGQTDTCISETAKYFCKNATGFSFEIEPDTCVVKAFVNSTKKYEGGLDGLAQASLEGFPSVRYEIEAIWSQNSDSQYYGRASYEFEVEQSTPSNLYLHTKKDKKDLDTDLNQIEAGNFVIVEITNVNDISKIKFSSTPEVPTKPVFFQKGNDAISLVPISKDAGDATYTFSVSYREYSENFTFKVTKQNTITDQGETYYAGVRLTETTLKTMNSLISEIGLQYSDKVYISNSFFNYETNDGLGKDNSPFKIDCDFGYIKPYSDGKTFVYNGVGYASPLGQYVPAINSGVVCKIGEDKILGNYIVVDHGYGIKSWYCRIAYHNLSIGDSVIRGHPIAQTGKTGLTNINGFYLITTVLDMPVSPDKFYEDEFIIKYFQKAIDN